MDSNTISNALKFLSSGWLGIALSVILAGLLVWFFFYKKSFLREKAKSETGSEADRTEQDQREQGSAHEETEAERRKRVGDFLGGE